jgi:hypothetical protein
VKDRKRLMLGHVLAAAAGLAACGPSRLLHEGPDVAIVPAGYVMSPNCSSGRVVFPEREVALQRCYFRMRIDDDGEHGSIVITEFPGDCTRELAEAARAGLAARHRECQYGPLEEMTVDRRPAWGWMESQSLEGEVRALQYKAIVAHEHATYSVEFYSSEKRTMDEALMRKVVASFRYQKPA